MNSKVLQKISIVTPVYNEELGLTDFEKQVNNSLLLNTEYDFEVLLVDDGSSDNSWQIIGDICKNNKKFKGIRLSRNYGAHLAISAGFVQAIGDAVVVLACDLQDPPEVILKFINKWQAGAKIVWGKREEREDGSWRSVASSIFTRLLSKHAMPKGSKFTTGSFLLADRKVIDCFNQFQEHNRITFALVAWTGFNQEVVNYKRTTRRFGKSKWRMADLLKAMYDTFIGFSLLPIRLITLLGAGLFILSVLLLVYFLYSWFFGHPILGWTSQVMISTFFFGIQFLLMGIVGEYLYRIHSEVTRRPLFFVSETISEKTDVIK